MFNVPAVFAQSSPCPSADRVYVTAPQPAQYQGDLQDYFQKALVDHSGITGTIDLSLLIDTSGRACCNNIQENTTGLDKEKIYEAVRGLTWTPAQNGAGKVVFMVPVWMKFSNNGVTVTYHASKAEPLKPVINPNTSNHPEVTKDKKTKTEWKQWTFANSMLPCDRVHHVAIDGNGIVWICTDYGIVRIDGEKWQVFNGVNTPALARINNSTLTLDLAVDKNNTVWVISYPDIVKYDGSTWSKVDSSNSTLEGGINRIRTNKEGDVWFSTNKGFVRFDGKKWSRFDTANSSIPTNKVYDTYADSQGALWVATDKGISKFASGQWSHFDTQNGLPSNRTSFITGDSKGNIYAALSEKQTCWLVSIDAQGKIKSYASPSIWCIIANDPSGSNWIGTGGKGLVPFDDMGVHTDVEDDSPLAYATYVADLVFDKAGNKWFATMTGLFYFGKY